MNLFSKIIKVFGGIWKALEEGWRKVEYPEDGKLHTPNRTYKSWSPKVEVEGDENLNEESPKYPWEEWRIPHWDKVVIFRPVVHNKEDANFAVGFSSKVEKSMTGFVDKIREIIIKLTNRFAETEMAAGSSRKVSEGKFVMRVGPDDCDYFIASEEAGLDLELEVDSYTDERKLDDDIYLY